MTLRQLRLVALHLAIILTYSVAVAVPSDPTGNNCSAWEDDFPEDADSLYDTQKIWSIHLKFEADQWKAMEPRRSQNQGNPFGRFGQRPDANQTAARGAELLTPVIMSQGDRNRDGVLSATEWTDLGQAWFRTWDKSGTGRISESAFMAGIETLRSPIAGGIPLIGEEGKRNGIASAMMGIHFEYVHADLEFSGRTFSNVAVRYKGNGTFLEASDNRKRSFKIDLNEFEDNQTLAGISTLNLQNNITDPGWMNEVLAYRLYRDAGVSAPRTSYAQVYITVPGVFDREYFGLYSLSENVDKQFVKDNFKVKGGAIFKPVTPSLFADMGADWSAYNQMYDPKSKLTESQMKAMMNLCQFVTSASDDEFSARIGDYIDLPAFARFLAVMVYLSDIDGVLGPGQNMYLYQHPDTEKFIFIPWDQDRSWGQFARVSQEQRDQLSLMQPWQGEKPFFERMFRVDSFVESYRSVFEEFSTTIFSPERISKQVDELAEVIRPVLKDEPTPSLQRFELAAAGKTIPPASRNRFGAAETQPIKAFVKIRTQSILDQLSGKSEGLTLSNGPGFFPGGPGTRSELAATAGPLLYRTLTSDLADKELTESAFNQKFELLFTSLNTHPSKTLNYKQLREGLQKRFQDP